LRLAANGQLLQIECAKKGSASAALKDFILFDPSGTETFLCCGKGQLKRLPPQEESSHVVLAQLPVQQTIDEKPVLICDCYNDCCLFEML
jgi:hypothetical protein